MILLKYWSVIASPYKTLHLQGKVYGHKKFNNGDEIITSEIQSFNAFNGTCTTKNTEYTLPNFDPNKISFDVKF